MNTFERVTDIQPISRKTSSSSRVRLIKIVESFWFPMVFYGKDKCSVFSNVGYGQIWGSIGMIVLVMDIWRFTWYLIISVFRLG